MEKQPSQIKLVCIALGALMGWSAVVLQLYLSIVNRATPVPETIIRFFSYYTILTNILTALCFTSLWLHSAGGASRFFSKTKTLTATAVYILVVGIVYNSILRFTWNPQGMQRVVDELLHLVMPLWFILFWFLFVPKARLQWKDVFPWLIYPFIYLVYILLRGAWSGFYPYPFVDVNALGYKGVAINSAGLFVAFLGLSLLFVAVAKGMSRKG